MSVGQGRALLKISNREGDSHVDDAVVGHGKALLIKAITRESLVCVGCMKLRSQRHRSDTRRTVCLDSVATRHRQTSLEQQLSEPETRDSCDSGIVQNRRE